jgi:hypothetical protein
VHDGLSRESQPSFATHPVLISASAALAILYTHTGASEFAWSIGEQPAACPFVTAIIGL